MRALRLVPAAVLLLTTGSAHAALKLNYERKRAADTGAPGTGTIIIDAEHIRMEGMGGGGRMGGRMGGGGGVGGGGNGATMIVDAPGKRFLIIETEKKAYREITEADAKQMKQAMAERRTQMEAHLKDAPPERRKQMEEIMNRAGGQGFEVKYEPMGTKKKVSGFACEMYKVQVATMTSEACIAPWSSNVITKAEIAQFKKLAAELEKTFADMGGRMMGEWSKAPGITVETTRLGPDGKPEMTTTLKSITRGDVPAAQFQPPAGFTKDTTPMFGGGGGGGWGGRRGGGPGGPGGPPPATP